MKSLRNSVDHLLFMAMVGLAAWAVPGAGHLLIRENKRAVIICITVSGLFFTGL